MPKNGIYALNVSLPTWKRVMNERTLPKQTVDQTLLMIFEELDELRMEKMKQATLGIIQERLEKINKGEV